MGDSDSCTTFAPCFDDPSLGATTAWARSSLLAAREPRRTAGLGLVARIPVRLVHKERCRSPRFLEDPCRHAVFCGPRRSRSAMVVGAAGVAYRRKESVGLLVFCLSGLNHTARRARCLRFAARVTPRPRKTRFTGADRASGPGLDTRRVPSRTFASASQLMLPPPRLCLAQLR